MKFKMYSAALIYISYYFQEDFYYLGDVAFPIRWCAPESLLCTETMIEAKDISKEANIWFVSHYLKQKICNFI